MNRRFLGMIAQLLALALLAGCSMPPQSLRESLQATPQPQAGEPAAPAEEPGEAEEEPEAPAEEPQGGEPGEAAAGTAEESAAEAETALEALFESLRGRVFPGTAGSSLSAAACAGALADYFAESGVSPDTVDGAVRRFRGALSSEDAALFETQLNAVVGAFSALTAEGGEGLLTDCGYESAHYPWSEGNVRDCFVALLGSD